MVYKTESPSKLPARTDTVVVGGGVSGLSALHRLRTAGVDAFLVEGSLRVGGTIRTVEAPWGGVVDMGPATLRGNSAELIRLIEEIGLAGEVVEADPSARHRFILRRGRPLPLPTSPKGIIETGLLSVPGKLRALGERFVVRGEGEESVAEFFRRRFGQEVLDYLVDPFVAGIYAGDPARLSLRQTFPMLAEMEREHGSLIRGALARKKRVKGTETKKAAVRPFSFTGGLSRLPDRLAELHAEAIAVAAPVMGLAREGEGWKVTTRHGAISSRRVILATGAEMASDLLRPLDEPGAEVLDAIESSPVTVVQLLYDAGAFPARPSGFGLLVPAVERRQVLGVIYTSSIFPERVAEDEVLLTVFIGGARQPELTELGHRDLVEVASAEIADIVGASASPRDSLVQLWRPGIPQYTVGYDRVLEGLDRIEQRHPGLTLLGSYRGGVSVPDCVERGGAIAVSGE